MNTPSDRENENSQSNPLNAALQNVKVGEIGVSTAAGFCSGYALKVVGRGAAVLVGVSFMGLQGLQYGGYIDINWDKIGDSFKRQFDLNKDNKVDSKDLQVASSRVQTVLSRGLPDAAGFAVGFYLGVKLG